MLHTTRHTWHGLLNVLVLLSLVAGLLAPTIALAQDGEGDGLEGPVSAESQSTTEPPPVTEEPSATEAPTIATEPPAATEPPPVATDPPPVATNPPAEPLATDPPGDDGDVPDETNSVGPGLLAPAAEGDAEPFDTPAYSAVISITSVTCTESGGRIAGTVHFSGPADPDRPPSHLRRIEVLDLSSPPGAGGQFAIDADQWSDGAMAFDLPFPRLNWQGLETVGSIQLEASHYDVVQWGFPLTLAVSPVDVSACFGETPPPTEEPTEIPTEVSTEEPTEIPTEESTPTPPPTSSEILKDDEAGWFQAISVDCFGRLTYAYDVPEETTALAILTGHFVRDLGGEDTELTSSHQNYDIIVVPAGRGVAVAQLTWWSNWLPSQEEWTRFVASVGWPEPPATGMWEWAPARHVARIGVTGCLGTTGDAPEWEAPDVPWFTDDVPTEVPTDEPEDTIKPTIESFTVDMTQAEACTFGGGGTVSGTIFVSNTMAQGLSVRIEVFWETPVNEWGYSGQHWGNGHYGSVFNWSDEPIEINGPWSFSKLPPSPEYRGHGYNRPDDATVLVFRAETGTNRWHVGGDPPDTQTIVYSLADCGEPEPTELPATEPPVTEPPATEPPTGSEFDGMFEAISLDCYGRLTYRYDLGEPRYMRFDLWGERSSILDQHLDYLHPAGQGVATHQFENGDPGSYHELMGTIHWSSDHEPEWGGDDHWTEAYANGCRGITGTPESTPDVQLVQVPMSLIVCGDEACESEGYDADGFYATWTISSVAGMWQGAVSGEIGWGSIQTLTSPLPVGEWEICLVPRLDSPFGTSIEFIPPDCEVITLREGVGHDWIDFQLPYQPFDVIGTPTEPPVPEPPLGHEMYEAISLDCYGRLTYRYNLAEPTIVQFELLNQRYLSLDLHVDYLHPAGTGIGTFQFENSEPGVFDALTGSMHWIAVDPYGGPSNPYFSDAYASGCSGVTGTPESTPDAQLVQVPLMLTLCGDEECASGSDGLGGFIATWTIAPVAGGEEATVSAVMEFGQTHVFTPPLPVGEWNVCLVPRLDHPSGTSVEVVPPACQIVSLQEGAGHGWVMFFLPYQPFDIIETPTEPPATEPPVTEPPATEPPATDPPATEPPVTEPPVTEPPATDPPVTEPPVTEPPVTEPPATEPPVTEAPVEGAAVPMSLVLCGNDDCTPPHRTDADGFTATWEFTRIAEEQRAIRAFFQQPEPETITVSAVIQNGTASATSPVLAAGTWAACLQPVLTRVDGATIRLFDAPQCDTVTIAADGEVSAVQTALPATTELAIEGGSTSGPGTKPTTPSHPGTSTGTTGGGSASNQGTASSGSSASASGASSLPVTGAGSAEASGTMQAVLAMLMAATLLAGTALQVRRRA